MVHQDFSRRGLTTKGISGLLEREETCNMEEGIEQETICRQGRKEIQPVYTHKCTQSLNVIRIVERWPTTVVASQFQTHASLRGFVMLG